jgi:hypothetical protein
VVWFNQECYEARAEYKSARIVFIKRNDNQQLRENYISLLNNYDQMKRKQKKRYNYQESIQLNKISKLEPRKFWNKKGDRYTKTSKKAETLKTTDVYEHFKTLNSTDNVYDNVNYDQISMRI